MKYFARLSPAWLLLIATAILLLGGNLFREGMFIDGVFYAILSRNLSFGLGSFWEPFFTPTYEPIFHAHPPLFFWLQSALFDLFGDHYWVERLFSLGTALLSGGLIHLLWQKF